ncbi:MAG: AAA family ATPase, partial [Salinisphaera sp.]|nr:AAA family ATPase [Salinisphaera sp.]
MRLTAIKLAGFKSFVEPTTLVLDKSLTGIVGPNGCGKSNVIDAVRWVTGESSAKQLRGEALVDVIFNGSRARKPVGRASVELQFDNSDAGIGGAYAGFSEIAIRRELARDGTSSYAINGTRSRRRDVVDLFLGTGLGGRSNYAVIEQGAVNRLIEAKPEDLRQVLEEAAGISRYKERRRETETRLRHTRENLDRLNDLIGEVSERLARLQRQAANAEKYKKYKAQERRCRAELLALRWRELQSEGERAQASLDERRRAAEAARGRARDAAARRQAQTEDQQRAGHETQDRQAAFYAAEGEVARAEQTLAHAREIQRLQAAEGEDLARQCNALATRIDGEQAATVALARGIDAIAQDLETLGAQAARARTELSEAERLAGEFES